MKTTAFDDYKAMIKANIIITLFMNISLKRTFNKSLQFLIILNKTMFRNVEIKFCDAQLKSC